MIYNVQQTKRDVFVVESDSIIDFANKVFYGSEEREL
jgi:hypothetical protein